MKKTLLMLALAATGTSALAQVGQQVWKSKGGIDIRPSERLLRSVNGPNPTTTTPATPASTNKNLPICDYGTAIGFTYHDWQYYTGAPQAIQRFSNGTLGVAWQLGRKGIIGSRGIGFNLQSPSGTWCAGVPNKAFSDSLKYMAGGEDRYLYSTTSLLGTTSSIRNIYNNKRSFHFSLLPINNNGGFTMLFNTQGPNDRPYGLNGQPTQDSSLVRRRIANFISNNATCRPTAGFSFDRRLPSVDDAQYASDGTNLYVVGTTTDTINTVPRAEVLASGNQNPLIFGKSTDNGVTWTMKVIPNTVRNKGFGSAHTLGAFNIDAKGSVVAIVANFMMHKPSVGMATVLLKSNNGGETFTTTIIDQVSVDDTNRVSPISRPGMFTCLTNDGAFNVLIDNYNNVHVTVGRGFMITDTAAGAFSVGYTNGGFLNLAGGRLMYWSEYKKPGESFELIGEFVDNDKDGIIRFPPSGDAAEPGDYIQSGMSQSTLVEDRYGNLYVVYSALTEGTESCCNAKTTRDIYVMGSRDGGRHWTNPVSFANMNDYDDGVTRGAGATEEFMPLALKRLGSDDKLHTIFFSDEVSGLNANGIFTPNPEYTSVNWLPQTIQYAAPNVQNLWREFIWAEFNTTACAGRIDSVTFLPASSCGWSAGQTITVELDTSTTGTFTRTSAIVNLGTYTTSSVAAKDKIMFTVPLGIATGTHRIRLSSTIARAGCADNTTYPERLFYKSSEYDYIVTGAAPASSGTVSFNPSSDAVCSGATLLLTTSGSPIAVDYTWSVTPPTGANISGNASSALLRLDPADTATTRSYVISVTANNGCGSATASLKTLTMTKVKLTQDANNVLSSTSTTATTGYTWTYNGVTIVGATGPTFRASNDSVGTYCLTGPGLACEACFQTKKDFAVNSVSEDLNKSLKLYPNPAKGFFNVELTNWSADVSAKVNVYNTLGALVNVSEVVANGGKAEATIETAGMAKGVYIVQVSTGKQVVTRRLVVE